MNTEKDRRFAATQGRFVACFALLVLILISGCGTDQLEVHPVSGTVRFEDGSAVMFGDVEFFNDDHRVNARGKIKRDGTFTVSTFTDSDGAVSGKHIVTILQITSDHRTEKLSRRIDHDHGDLIDPAYFDYRTSGLECEIQPGQDNHVEFVVKKRRRQTEDGMPVKQGPRR